MFRRLREKVLGNYRRGVLLRVTGNVLLKPFRRLLKGWSVFKRDWKNRRLYGPSAPRHMETIWVNPREIKFLVPREEIRKVTGLSRDEASGCVIDWSGIQKVEPLYDQFRIQYCLKHWREGYSWDELGVYEHMSQTKKYGEDPMSKIVARFEMLDEAFEQTKIWGRMKSRGELDPSNFREKDGVLVHIGKGGEPFFGGNGFHRLGIALALDLTLIPACIGVVDRHAIEHLHKYRQTGILKNTNE